ncbi:phage N-6-adenine-methyltransferase [Pasteurella oralis]|uniref:Phage N-6-adenine-methyltransferase n=1 Tax=Pasteurella oralis TaxID=1071947 RepID=A0ABW4NW06_9PAST
MNISKTNKNDKDLWATPWWLFFFAEYYFDVKFDLDVCASAHNTKVKKYINQEQDTLKTVWSGRYCWFNPPYSNPLPFVMRAVEMATLHRKTVVMLLNVDNSTKWFNLCVRNAKEIVYITDKRVPFVHNQTRKAVDQNNKGQMLVLFAPENPLETLKSSYISMQKMKEIGERIKNEKKKLL